MPFDSKEYLSPARRALLVAADLIERHGLAKLTQRDAEGRLCLQGAISVAATGKTRQYTDIYCAASAAVYRYLTARGVPDGDTYVNGSAPWNNKPERTAAEVIEALRGAVAYVEEPATA